LALLIIITHQNCQQTHFLWWFGWIKRIKSSRISFSMKQPYELWLCFRLCKLFKGLISLLFFSCSFLPFFNFHVITYRRWKSIKLIAYDFIYFYLCLFLVLYFLSNLQFLKHFP
jgi:hypothetical protein